MPDLDDRVNMIVLPDDRIGMNGYCSESISLRMKKRYKVSWILCSTSTVLTQELSHVTDTRDRRIKKSFILTV